MVGMVRMAQDGGSAGVVAARLRAVRPAVRGARAAHDSLASEEALEEWEEALRVARRHGIQVLHDGDGPHGDGLHGDGLHGDGPHGDACGVGVVGW